MVNVDVSVVIESGTFREMCEIVLKRVQQFSYPFPAYSWDQVEQVRSAFVRRVAEGDWRVALDAAMAMRVVFTDSVMFYGPAKDRYAAAIKQLSDAIVRKMATEIVRDPANGIDVFSISYDGHTTPFWLAWTFAGPEAKSEYVGGAQKMHPVWRSQVAKQRKANKAWVWR